MLKPEFYQPVQNLDEAQKIQDIYTYFDANLVDFKLVGLPETTDDENEDAWKILVGGAEHDFTAQFLQSFSALLGIPYAFATHIPVDLLKTNVERLEPIRDCKVKVAVRDNILVNVYAYGKNKKTGSQLTFVPLSTSQLMEYFSDEKYKLRTCIVGDFGAVFDVLCADLGEVNLPVIKDQVKIGYRIVNPFTMTNDKLQMCLIAEQQGNNVLIGLPLKMGSVSQKLTKEFEEDKFFDDFKNKIDKYIAKRYSLEKIETVLKALEDCKIKYRFLGTFFNKMRSTDEGMFEQVTGILDWKAEKEIWLEKFEEEEAEDSIYDYHQVMCKMLTYALDELEVTLRMNLEAWMALPMKLNQKQLKLYPKEEKK